MKKLLAAMFVALLMVGCGEADLSDSDVVDAPPVVVDLSQLEERGGLAYFEEKPFTGVAVEKYPNGQKSWEATFKDGEQHGLETRWFENGQKKFEATYKDGEQHGLETWWFENGQKKEEGPYKDGKAHALWTSWFENGQKRGEATFKDDEQISLKEWDEDGNLLE